MERAIANLACAYHTPVEVIECYADMDSFSEWERLNAMRVWLEEALNEPVGTKRVERRAREAKSEDYSPYAA